MKKRSIAYLITALWLVPALALQAAPAEHAEAIADSMTHRMMMLAIQMGILLIAAKIGSLLAAKRNLPGVVGELMAGILMGPYLLGALQLPGFPHGLFPLFSEEFAVSPELYGVGTVASIVLMFTTGLETDLRLFLRYSGPAFLIGLSGVIASYLAGSAMGVLLFPLFLPGSYTMLSPACIMLGIVSTATSVGITARVLSEKRKLDTAEGTTILAGAVIDDVLGIICLAVGMGVIAASQTGNGTVNWAAIARIAAKSIGVWLGATAIGLLAARHISSFLKQVPDRADISIMATGLALLLAGLFEEARLAMIIGAYVMGLSLSRTDISQVVQDFLHPIYKLLVPIFFAVMGMLVNVRLLLDPRIFLSGVVFMIVANAVKVVGCGAPALLFGFNLRGAFRIGAGMMPRGEVALIMAGIGLAAGLLPNEAFSMIILATLLTTLIAPALLALLFTNPRSGQRNPAREPDTTTLTFQFPSEATTDLLVVKLRQAFESEGFFVHLINAPQKQYRIMKDDVFIRFENKPTRLIFSCDPAQQTFIKTAMFDVLAEFERTINELRKPINPSNLLQSSASQADTTAQTQIPHQERMRQALQKDLCIPRLLSETKEDLLQEMTNKINEYGLLQDPEQALEDVLQREQSMSTGMQDGIAIPHARTEAVQQLVCAIGLKPEGIDFGALDEKPSRIFVLTLSPRKGANPHIQFMASVSRILSNPETRTKLLAAQTSDDMLRVLEGKPPQARAQRVLSPVRAAMRAALSASSHRKPPQDMHTYIRPELVTPHLQGQDREAAFTELVQLMKKADAIHSTEIILEQILSREQAMSTAMEHGIAIPHARTDEVTQLTCAIGIHKEGLQLGAPDQSRSHILILTLSPNTTSAPHIQFISTLTQKLDANRRQRCLAAKDDRTLYQILTEPIS